MLFSFMTDYVAHVLKGIVQRERSVSTEGCFLKVPMPRTPSNIPHSTICGMMNPRFKDIVLKIHSACRTAF